MKKIKISSNAIIMVIVAFLAGIIITSVFSRDKGTENNNTSETVMEESTTPESGDVMEEQADKAVPAPVANDTADKPAPQSYSGSCAPYISGSKDIKLNAIVINWTPCDSGEFQFYKIVKSSKNPNPSYPADPVVVSSSNKNLTNHIDRTVTRATTYYYRACVVQRLGKVNCGNVVSVTF